MQPLASTWGVHAAGLVDLEVIKSERRQGVAIYLLSEAFRHLAAQGVSLVEAQVRSQDDPARALFEKLGFVEIDQAAAYRKD
jgi:ribosomal protein S18 acetylase RimI-like enzyme